jgi:hypothetical protein
VRITRNLAVPLTFALLLAGAACGGPHATSSSPPAARVVPANAPTTDDTVAEATGTAANPSAVTPPTAVDVTAADLTDVDRSLDQLDRDLTDLGQALTQTQEGDVDQ